MTFAATANAALYLGATVRFVDVEPDTGNIYAGHPADYDRINGIAGPVHRRKRLGGLLSSYYREAA